MEPTPLTLNPKRGQIHLISYKESTKKADAVFLYNSLNITLSFPGFLY